MVPSGVHAFIIQAPHKVSILWIACITSQLIPLYYRPQWYLMEGNVFTGLLVILFRYVSLVSDGDGWAWPVSRVCPGVGTHLHWHIVVATTHTVAKRAVRILLIFVPVAACYWYVESMFWYPDVQYWRLKPWKEYQLSFHIVGSLITVRSFTNTISQTGSQYSRIIHMVTYITRFGTYLL